ncbi:hypothetical protein [Aeromonas sobria]|uniref:hypothetical protein n=1 Tax=Aeromonas sobria TaxID=646 RepID=UPI003D027365
MPAPRQAGSDQQGQLQPSPSSSRTVTWRQSWIAAGPDVTLSLLSGPWSEWELSLV